MNVKEWMLAMITTGLTLVSVPLLGVEEGRNWVPIETEETEYSTVPSPNFTTIETRDLTCALSNLIFLNTKKFWGLYIIFK